MGMLAGKVALVTGSTSGIGLAVARTLASGGATIRMSGLGETGAIETLRREIEASFAVSATHHDADLADVGAIERLAAEIGPIDILVNNAGIQHVAPIEAFPAERWDALLAVNLSAAFHTIRLFLPAMKARGWGRIVNMSSVHGLVASVNKVAYVASKHGVVGLTKAVALEAARSGVTCNAICPGVVQTALAQAQIDAFAASHGLDEASATAAFLREKQPSEQIIRPEQIGELVAFLCSDAADQMTGSSLSMDGGWLAQ